MKLSPFQRVEVIAWYKAKTALGTFKTKAREMGLPVKTLHDVIRNLREREQRMAARIRRANGVRPIDVRSVPW